MGIIILGQDTQTALLQIFEIFAVKSLSRSHASPLKTDVIVANCCKVI